MNAGKSTFLNAILGKELLGTSTVPETANLTIIKHSPTPYAIVNFWNKSQWNQISNAAKHSQALAEFVQKTEDKFGDKLNE